MRGLIPEIQRNALDLNVPIDAILRKVKLCTTKLDLSSLEAWISQELDGYSSKAALPGYRELVGEPLALNPYNGWIPMFFKSANDRQAVTRVDVRQPISTLRDLIDNDNDNGMFYYPVPEYQVLAINRRMNFQSSRMVLKIGRTSIIMILETVRNMVLDWSVEMEKKGVLGEGMYFEPVEKERAERAMSTISIGGNFVGNLGNHNASRDIVSTSVVDVQVRAIVDAVSRIRDELPALRIAGADTEALAPYLDAVEKEAKSSAPNPRKLTSLLDGARSILVGAGGNLTAEGALALIAAAARAVGG